MSANGRRTPPSHLASPKVPPPAIGDCHAGADARRASLQFVAVQRLQPVAPRAGRDEHGVGGNRLLAVRDGLVVAEDHVVAEDRGLTGLDHIRNLPLDVEDVVLKERVFGLAHATPGALQDAEEFLLLADVKDVVVDLRVGARAAELEQPAHVVLADVVADDRACAADAIGHAQVAVVADEHEAAAVVVAVVVLEDGIAAIVVGIESLAVLVADHVADLVELQQGVVATPRPYASALVGGPGPTAVAGPC